MVLQKHNSERSTSFLVDIPQWKNCEMSLMEMGALEVVRFVTYKYTNSEREREWRGKELFSDISSLEFCRATSLL